METIRPCRQCKTSFKVNAIGRPAACCSSVCSRTYWKVQQKEKRRAYKNREELRICKACLQLFVVKKKYTKKKCCNRACAALWRKWQRLEIPLAIKQQVIKLLAA